MVFLHDVLPWYPLKTPENERFSDVFWGNKKEDSKDVIKT